MNLDVNNQCLADASLTNCLCFYLNSPPIMAIPWSPLYPSTWLSYVYWSWLFVHDYTCHFLFLSSLQVTYWTPVWNAITIYLVGLSTALPGFLKAYVGKMLLLSFIFRTGNVMALIVFIFPYLSGLKHRNFRWRLFLFLLIFRTLTIIY